MKKVFSFAMIFLLVFSLASCAAQSEQTESITTSNIKNYVNIQLVFGNVEQIIREDDDKQSSLIISSDRYLSCVCYVYVSPKSEYKFQNATVTFTIPPVGNLFNWSISGGKTTNSISNKWEETIYLDKEGYGVTSLKFYKNGDTGHPLDSEWEVKIIKATGNVSE